MLENVKGFSLIDFSTIKDKSNLRVFSIGGGYYGVSKVKTYKFKSKKKAKKFLKRNWKSILDGKYSSYSKETSSNRTYRTPKYSRNSIEKGYSSQSLSARSTESRLAPNRSLATYGEVYSDGRWYRIKGLDSCGFTTVGQAWAHRRRMLQGALI